jgi:1-pyrroline-5-carboxylate dehydrogenase
VLPSCVDFQLDDLITVQRTYAPGSADRAALVAAIQEMENALPFEVPCVVNGKEVSRIAPPRHGPTHKSFRDIAQIKSGDLAKQPIPSDHAKHLCVYHEADRYTVVKSIEGALAAKAEWEALPWSDRAAIFLKAADLVSGKYRYKLLAATMLGQGKNVWQAEIDAAAEVNEKS